MVDRMIQQYIDRLTMDDINVFAKQNGVSLSSSECQIVFSTIKEKWPVLLRGNTDQVFEEIKPYIEIRKYEKIKDLFYYFKEKYKNYL